MRLSIFEDTMTEMVEGGASLAWRLLATLEGGSLLLATSALLAYSARKRVVRLRRARRPVRSVLLTNTSNLLGKELKIRLESRGVVVHTLTHDALTEGLPNNAVSGAVSRAESGVAGGAASGAESRVVTDARGQILKVDALVVVGAFSPPKGTGLQGMAKLVSEDVYSNLKLLESLSCAVHRGGSLAWACAGAGSLGGSPWAGAGDAFDTVLQANLQHVAKMSHCEPVWVGRSSDAAQAAEKLVDALLSTNTQTAAGFSIRNTAQRAGEYVGRWLKIIT